MSTKQKEAGTSSGSPLGGAQGAGKDLQTPLTLSLDPTPPETTTKTPPKTYADVFVSPPCEWRLLASTLEKIGWGKLIRFDGTIGAIRAEKPPPNEMIQVKAGDVTHTISLSAQSGKLIDYKRTLPGGKRRGTAIDFRRLYGDPSWGELWRVAKSKDLEKTEKEEKRKKERQERKEKEKDRNGSLSESEKSRLELLEKRVKELEEMAAGRDVREKEEEAMARVVECRLEQQEEEMVKVKEKVESLEGKVGGLAQGIEAVGEKMEKRLVELQQTGLNQYKEMKETGQNQYKEMMVLLTTWRSQSREEESLMADSPSPPPPPPHSHGAPSEKSGFPTPQKSLSYDPQDPPSTPVRGTGKTEGRQTTMTSTPTPTTPSATFNAKKKQHALSY